MSYLIQELTNWWPLLSFRLDCNLSEGNNQIIVVYMCVCREKIRWQMDFSRVCANPVTPMQSFLMRLYCTCFLQYISQASLSGLALQGWGWGISVLHVKKKNWTKDSLKRSGYVRVCFTSTTAHAQTEHLLLFVFCFVFFNIFILSN